MKRRSRIALFVTVLAGFLYSCNDGNGTGPQPEQKKTRAIVLCDASNSTTLLATTTELQGTLPKLKDYIKKIPKWYALKSEVFYYPVSDNLISNQLGSKVSYNIETRSQLEPEIERIDSITNGVVREVDIIASQTKNSCILQSIGRCIKRFEELVKDRPGEEFTNELIIISDMLESCKLSDTADIRMTVLNSSRLTAAIEKFAKENTTLNVSNLDLTVRVIINTPWMGSRFEPIRKCWETWFEKIGVQKDKLFFYTGQPDIQDNPLLKIPD